MDGSDGWVWYWLHRSMYPYKGTRPRVTCTIIKIKASLLAVFVLLFFTISPQGPKEASLGLAKQKKASRCSCCLASVLLPAGEPDWVEGGERYRYGAYAQSLKTETLTTGLGDGESQQKAPTLANAKGFACLSRLPKRFPNSPPTAR